MTAPGGKAIHHVSRGGLLEHTLSMARLAVMVADHYGDKINTSVLLTGVLLHDAGKIYELEGVAAYEYTDRGTSDRASGHCIEMLNELLATIPDFPEAYVLVMKHMIASHHGIPEYGAIRQPQTMEALVLSFIDDLDAKVNSFAVFSPPWVTVKSGAATTACMNAPCLTGAMPCPRLTVRPA